MSARPSGIPRKIPAWAWKWLKWRTQKKPAPKPAPAPTPTPAPTPKPPPPTQMFMYDDVNLALIPANAPAVAGYVGGRWPTYGPMVAKFPHAKHLSIAISALENARCLDVEPGDATIAQAPGWVEPSGPLPLMLPPQPTSAMPATARANNRATKRSRRMRPTGSNSRSRAGRLKSRFRPTAAAAARQESEARRAIGAAIPPLRRPRAGRARPSGRRPHAPPGRG